MRRHKHRTGRMLAATLVFGVVCASCSPDDSPGEGRAGPAAAPPAPAEALAAYAKRLRESYRVRLRMARKWDLSAAPLVPPPPPVVKPPLVPSHHLPMEPGLPPVITRVPTTDPVVFLTIDDGAEKDPRFTEMMRDLNVPFSAFLSDYLARADYGYFLEHQTFGNFLQNHTINHPDLKLLSYERQYAEICDQQDQLERLTGVRPSLFRPPYGNYNTDTLRAAMACGVRVVPLWTQEAFPDRMEYREPGRGLRPGDIILTHFRGPEAWGATMPDVIRRVLGAVTEQGLAVARLEDYL